MDNSHLSSISKFGATRRGFLRGIGASIALPALESMRPLLAANVANRAIATTASGAPLRMAYFYVPNGVNQENWWPGKGSKNRSDGTFSPLAKLSEHFQTFRGFEHKNATSGPDGPGHHARGNATFLTGVRARKTAGSDIHLGISVDQLAANAVADHTRLASLELTTAGVRKSGQCDSGYSCAYQYNLSWRSETQPMTPESNPRAVYERLFGSGSSKERAKSLGQRLVSKKSLLDFISDDAKALSRHLGRNDKQKLDEYLAGVREVEKQIEKVESLGLPIDPGVSAPKENPSDFSEQLRLLMDMMVLAFKTDSTRISTMMMSNEGSNRSFKEIGVSEGHHSISHHQSNKDKLDKLAKIDHFYMENFAYFLEKMKSTEDVDGKSLLHNSMIVYGSCISDGNRHNNNDLPIVLAGNGGGVFKPGGFNQFESNTPLSNLHLRMLHEMGVKPDRFGDSTGIQKRL